MEKIEVKYQARLSHSRYIQGETYKHHYLYALIVCDVSN